MHQSGSTYVWVSTYVQTDSFAYALATCLAALSVSQSNEPQIRKIADVATFCKPPNQLCLHQSTNLRGVIRTAHTACCMVSLITHKKKRVYTSPYMSQEQCVPRGVSKASSYFEVAGYSFCLVFGQFHGFTPSCLRGTTPGLRVVFRAFFLGGGGVPIFAQHSMWPPWALGQPSLGAPGVGRVNAQG